MITVYKYIHFEEVEHDLWMCSNNKTNAWLCTIEYYSPWRQYVTVQFDPDCVFNSSCLRNIAEFLEQLKSVKSTVRKVGEV